VIACPSRRGTVSLSAAGGRTASSRWPCGAGVVAALPAAFLFWIWRRDRWPGSAWSIKGLALMTAATLGGVTAGFLLVGALRLGWRALRRLAPAEPVWS